MISGGGALDGPYSVSACWERQKRTIDLIALDDAVDVRHGFAAAAVAAVSPLFGTEM